MYQTPLPTLIRALRIAVLCSCFHETAVAAPPKPDLTYERTQTYKGQAFDKDEHVWIYNKAFADKFRMPAAWVNEDLKGIEAAAFRVGEMELTCGLGRNEATCARLMHCLLDIYVDEKKTPLPWLEDKTADWLPGPDSFQWLFDAESNAPGRPYPAVLEPDDSGFRTLRPFGDKQLKRPAYYQSNDGTPRDNEYGWLQIYAFQRHLHGDLSMVRLSYGCLTRNKRPYTSFRLMLDTKPIRYIDDPKIKGARDPVYGPRPIYHAFQLPAAFERRIDGVLESRSKAEVARYKQILNAQ